jgi:hypothetical protein
MMKKINNYFNSKTLTDYFLIIYVCWVVGSFFLVFSFNRLFEDEKMNIDAIVSSCAFFGLIVSLMSTSMEKKNRKIKSFLEKIRKIKIEIEQADTFKKVLEIWGGSFYELINKNPDIIVQPVLEKEIKILEIILRTKAETFKQVHKNNVKAVEDTKEDLKETAKKILLATLLSENGNNSFDVEYNSQITEDVIEAMIEFNKFQSEKMYNEFEILDIIHLSCLEGMLIQTKINDQRKPVTERIKDFQFKILTEYKKNKISKDERV